MVTGWFVLLADCGLVVRALINCANLATNCQVWVKIRQWFDKGSVVHVLRSHTRVECQHRIVPQSSHRRVTKIGDASAQPCRWYFSAKKEMIFAPKYRCTQWRNQIVMTQPAATGL